MSRSNRRTVLIAIAGAAGAYYGGSSTWNRTGSEDARADASTTTDDESDTDVTPNGNYSSEEEMGVEGDANEEDDPGADGDGAEGDGENEADENAVVGSGWSSYRYAEGNTAFASTVSGPTDGVEVSWSIEDVRGPVVALGDTVYGGGDRLLALDSTTGENRWSVPSGETGEPRFYTPAVIDGTVYAASARDGVYALDAQTGDQRWHTRAPTGANTATPVTLADGRVFVVWHAATVDEVESLRGDLLVAYDAETGEEEWRAFGGEYDYHGGRAPGVAVSGETVFFAADGLRALDAETGTERWQYPGWFKRTGAPAVTVGTVYVGDGWPSGTFCAVDAATGEERWTYRTDAEVVWSAPAVAEGVVYVGVTDEADPDRTHLLALDGADGFERWKANDPGTGPARSPAVADAVYGSGYAIDPVDGAVLWYHDDFDVSPALADGAVFLGGTKLTSESG